MGFFKKKYSDTVSTAVSSLWTHICCWALLLLVFFLDYLVKYRVSFSLFYIVPILFTSRYAGIRPSITMALIAALFWHFADISSGYVYASPVFAYWNAIVRLTLFILVPLLFHFWREENRNAARDPLTGLPNRRSFMETADYEIKKCRRYGHPLSIAFIDLDNFKSVNDKHGHQVGDVLLGQIASSLTKNIRDTDTLARIGGDEFVLLMPETDEASAFSVLTRDLNRVAQPLFSGVYSAVTLSVGIVTCISSPLELDNLMKVADQLMYEAKKAGKNCIKTALYKERNVNPAKVNEPQNSKT